MDDDVTSPPLSSLHDRRTQNDYSTTEYGVHVPPSNFFLPCPSHLFYANRDQYQHLQVLLALAQTVEGHDQVGGTLRAKNI